MANSNYYHQKQNLKQAYCNQPEKKLIPCAQFHSMSSGLFRKVGPQTPEALQYDHLYDVLKPLWIELRVLGVLPVAKNAEHGAAVFKRTFKAMLYSVIFYVAMGAYVTHTGMVKYAEIKALKKNQFDELVNGYLFLMYLLPQITIPLFHWKQAGQIACFLNDWTTFQVHFRQMTKNTLPLKAGNKYIAMLTIIVPLLSTAVIVIEWYVMPEFKSLEIFCYSYITTLVHLHITMWYVMCCSVAKSVHHLITILQKEVDNAGPIIQVSNYCSLWQDLCRLSRKMGDSFCYIYGTIVVIWFATLTLSLYGGLTGMLEQSCSLRDIALICNTALCTVMLFVICDAGERLAEEMGPNFLESLQTLYLQVSNEVRKELNSLRYDVAMNRPDISLGGYFSVNRSLLLSLLATVVSQMVILLQFRIGSGPDSSTHASIFNESCKLMCKD